MAERPPGAIVSVVGVADDRFELLSPEARSALAEARVVVGGRRHLSLLERWPIGRSGAPHLLPISGDLEEVMGRVGAVVLGERGPVCVLASGDPGFFGILRTLLRHLDRDQLSVFPAPSSVAVAFARLALPWDDAVVVSAHGRPLDAAVRVARTGGKVAVLTSPDSPPESLGRALRDAGCVPDLTAVCSRLGSADEVVREVSLDELAEGHFDPLSVVVLLGPGALPLVGWSAAGSAGSDPESTRVLAWGRDDAHYEHRAGMITKAETRAVILAKLGLPDRGVLWDVGSGSGSVAIESGLLAPGLTVFAIERDPASAERISENASRAGVGVHVVVGEAPAAWSSLPVPDRVFVGGGGPGVLEAALGRLAPGGHAVASFAAMDRALEGARLLGHLVQLRSDRAEPLGDGGWRLVANNPVFVAWGPAHEPTGGP